jgi:hypothetical protein
LVFICTIFIFIAVYLFRHLLKQTQIYISFFNCEHLPTMFFITKRLTPHQITFAGILLSSKKMGTHFWIA